MSGTPQVGFQITSDPDTTGFGAPRAAPVAVRDSERRVRFLLVADLDPQAPSPDWQGETLVQPVDATTFADVLSAWSPRLDVSVADHLGATGGHRDVAWTVDAMDALTPAGIVRRAPALAAVADARTAIAEARSGSLTLDALRDRLRDAGLDGADALADAVASRPASTQEAPTGSSDGLDRLLGLMDMGDASPPPRSPAGSAVDAIIGAAVGQKAETGVDNVAADRVLAGLDARLRAQTVAVLDHPDTRRLEAAWRGLKFLVDRLAFRRGARLEILAAAKGDLAEALHFQVLLPEHAEGLERVPLAAVVVDHAFSATSADLASLTNLAEIGGSLQAPVVTSAAPGFFGFDAPTDLARLPPAVSHLERPEYAAFRSLRTRPEAPFLTVALPPFVLRPPYGPDYADRAHGTEGGETLWGGGALIVAAAMAARHAETGWPTAPAGTAVENLIVRKTRMGALPLAAAFGESVLQDLARAGLLGLSGPLQSDRAVLGPPVSVSRPKEGTSEARAQVSLPAAVFSAIASHKALSMAPELAGMDGAEAVSEIDGRFRALMAGGALTDEAVTVQAMPEHETETTRTFGVRLRPQERILGGQIGVVFGVDIDKGTGSTTAAPDGAPADGQ